MSTGVADSRSPRALDRNASEGIRGSRKSSPSRGHSHCRSVGPGRVVIALAIRAWPLVVTPAVYDAAPRERFSRLYARCSGAGER